MNQTVESAVQGQVNRSQTNVYTSRILFVLGIVSVFLGQQVFQNPRRDSATEGWIQLVVAAMFLAGAVLFGVFGRESLVKFPRLEFPRRNPHVSQFVWYDRWTVAWLALAVGLALVALGGFLRDGENQIVRLLWLASVAALLIAPLKDIRLGLPKFSRQESVYLAVLAVLLVVTFITRMYKLTLLPWHVDGDFTEFGGLARKLLTGQEQRIFAFDDWGGMPMLGYLPSGLTMSLWGTNLFGLYMSGVIEGLIVIVGVYLLGRDLFSASVGLFAAALLTVSYTHLLASRQSNFIDPVPFLVFSIYLLLIGLRQGRKWALVSSGILTALCVQMYFSGRIVVLIIGFLLFYLLVFRPPWLRKRSPAVVLWVLAVLITLGPMLVLFARDSDKFMARSSGIFVLSPHIVTHLEGKYKVTTVAGVLFEQARRTALMFNYYSDTGPQFGFPHPFLDPITGPLFILGLGFALVHWRRLGDALMPAWVILGAVFGSFLTVDAPSWSRLMILLPPTALLAARALDVIYAEASRSLLARTRYSQFLAPAAVAILLAAIGIMNWNTYVDAKGTYASPATRIARYLQAQPLTTQGYLVSSVLPYDAREFRFLVPGRLVANLTDADIRDDVPRVGAPTLVFMTSEESDVLEKLEQLYPGGMLETHMGNAPDQVAFYVFRLP